MYRCSFVEELMNVKTIVDAEIYTRFPGYIRGVVIAKDIDNSGEKPALVELLRKVEMEATTNESLVDIKNHPHIAGWRQIYTAFGSNPNKFYSSIESLCRRARRGDQLAYINTAVALFNYFSLKYIVPSGGDDIRAASGDLRLTIAKGDELFTPFNTSESEKVTAGEVIYRDDSIVMCRRWNWRQGDRTKVTPETKNIAINVDCLPLFSREKAEAMTSELAGMMKDFCCGHITYALLESGHNEFEL
jgi:DNA/RNA-binding domain of Phe-tRNA-synthetase-like protein